jgi:hypothetical protein
MIYDTDGNRILSTALDVRSGEDEIITLKIDCLTGWQLSGEAVADVAVEARHQGDAYVNIETTPISLTPWNGTLQTFEIRLTAGTITTALTRSFTLSVGRA